MARKNKITIPKDVLEKREEQLDNHTSQCSVCDSIYKRLKEETEDREELVYKTFKSCGRACLFFLARYILIYTKLLERVHLPICRDVTSGYTEKDKDAQRTRMLLAPRGSFKSTLCSEAFPIWLIIRNPNIRILMTSAHLKLPRRFLYQIKNILATNGVFRQHYGNFVPDLNDRKAVWTQYDIIVSKRTIPTKDPTIGISSVMRGRAGLHVDVIIADDVHDEKNHKTETGLESVIGHIEENTSVLSPQGYYLLIGSRWIEGDAYQYYQELEEDGLRWLDEIMSYKVRNKKGELWFPEELNAKFLAKVRMARGKAYYYAQYHNEIIGDENSPFYSIQVVDSSILSSNILRNAYMGIDPSMGKDTGFYQAFVILAVGEDEDVYIIDSDMAHDRVNAFETNCIRALKRYKNRFSYDVKAIAYESVGFQEEVAKKLRARLRKVGLNIPLKLTPPFKGTDNTTDKDARIRMLSIPCELNKLFVIQDKRNKKFMRIARAYPRVAKKDILDAAAYAYHISKPAFYRVKKAKKKRRYHRLIGQALAKNGKDIYTGY